MKKNVLMICPNFHNENDTCTFVKELINQSSFEESNIIVVDNSERKSIDIKLQELEKLDSRITILKPTKNLGYFGASSWALLEYLKFSPLPEWIVISNTDMSFLDANFFSKLFNLYPQGVDGVIAPSIYSSLTQQHQNPYMKTRPKSSRMHFYKYIFGFYTLATIYQILSLLKSKFKRLIKKENNQVIDHGPYEIYAPHGSFIIFNKSYFEKGGNLQHDVLLFGEEIKVAETVKELKQKVLYEPRLLINHREHATTGIIKSKKIRKFMGESSRYCAEKYF